jgi:hypothetical protein
MRPRTQTTAAPSMAKPMTLSPSPTGAVSVTWTVGGGGLEELSEHEAQAKASPASGIRNAFRYWRRRARRHGLQGEGVCLKRWVIFHSLVGVSKRKEARHHCRARASR